MEKMQILTIVIVLFSLFSVTSAGDQTCARKFFQKERIRNFVVVDSPKAKTNDLLTEFLRSYDHTYDWSVTVVSHIASAVDGQANDMERNVVLFASSPDDIDPFYKIAQLTKTRIFIYISHKFFVGSGSTYIRTNQLQNAEPTGRFA